MADEIRRSYEFGDFRFDAGRRVLWRRGEVVALPPRATDVLFCLLSDHGNLVERETLIRNVWQDTFVEEGNLNHAISTLRRTLGSENIIQTVPKRGYRFAADVSEVIGYPETELVFERHTVSETQILELEEIDDEDASTAITPHRGVRSGFGRRQVLVAAVFVAAALMVGVWYLYPRTGVARQQPNLAPKILAILPLRPINGGEADKTFALGVTESLAARLGQLDQLVVRPTSSAASLAETENDPIVIGKKLGSDAVLEGSYQMSVGRIRITVRLLNVADGSQIWSGSFDEAESDVFKLQDSLSAQAATQLIDRLSPVQQKLLTTRHTDNVDAYKLYVRGRYAWNKRTKDSLLESVRLFQAAVDADPTFSLAYAGLADSYVLLNDYDAAPPDESYPKAKAAAVKALEIQPDLVEPRVTLAYVLATYDWNWADAESEYRRAIEIQPNYPTAHQWYGEMLYTIKRFSEAEIELRKAAALDPLAPIIQSEIGVVMYYSGRYDDAIAQFSKLKIDYPQFPTSYLFLAWIYDQKGDFDRSVAEEIAHYKLLNFGDAVINEMESAYRRGGRTAFLQHFARDLEKASNDQYFAEYRLVHIYGRLGDLENTLKWLEKGVEKRSSNIVKVFVDPHFAFLRDEPRFRTVLDHMGLGEVR